MTRPVPTVHLAGAIPRRTACRSHVHVGMPGTVTASPARVTCGRCSRVIDSRRAGQPPVATR